MFQASKDAYFAPPAASFFIKTYQQFFFILFSWHVVSKEAENL